MRHIFVSAIHISLFAIHTGSKNQDFRCLITDVRVSGRPKMTVEKYKRCIFAGKKASAGAHPGAQSLESTCVMYLRHKNQDSMYQK